MDTLGCGSAESPTGEGFRFAILSPTDSRYAEYFSTQTQYEEYHHAPYTIKAVPNELLVGFKHGYEPAAVVAKYGGRIIRESSVDIGYVIHVDQPSASNIDAIQSLAECSGLTGEYLFRGESIAHLFKVQLQLLREDGVEWAHLNTLSFDK